MTWETLKKSSNYNTNKIEYIKKLSKSFNYSEETIINLTNALLLYNKDLDYEKINYNNDEFKQWLVGFFDAEGSFRMNRRSDTRYELNIVLKLHKDDILVLEKVKLLFNVEDLKIYHSASENTVSLSIGTKNVLLNKVIPLFDKYPLLTKKNYDYNLWKEALLIYNDETLSRIDAVKKLDLIKAKINNYDEKNSDKYPTAEFVNKYFNLFWLIGFIEGEGSFSIKSTKDALHFSLTQHKASIIVMQKILNFLLVSSPDKNCPIKDEMKKISNKLYPDRNKLRVITTTVDFHYWVLIPLFLKYPFQARKGTDFLLWSILVILKKHGILPTDQGQQLLNEIKKIHNSKRYTNKNLVPISDLINTISLDPVFDLNLSHDTNSRKNRYKK